jgi:hypothetical protein
MLVFSSQLSDLLSHLDTTCQAMSFPFPFEKCVALPQPYHSKANCADFS